MKKSKKPLKLKAGALTIGPFKKVTYYQADIEGTDSHLEMIASVGRQVITQQQYINIGINHIIMNMVNNKFELPPANKTLKPQKKKQVKASRGVLVDPPSGWQYGFPARYIKEEHGSMEDFLRLKKYPEKDITFAMQNMRHIGEEET
jgi:hypothetical protein